MNFISSSQSSKFPLFGSFWRSFQELKNLRSLLVAAMLLAIHTVLSVFVSIQVTESLRISISFIANVLTACLFGPVVGLLNAALGDILQFFIKPVGGYFFGWTLNAALAGLIYGLAFYGRLPQTAKSAESSKSTESSDSKRQTIPFLRFLPLLISALILICWFFAPFLSILEINIEAQTAFLALLPPVLHKSTMMLSALILVLSILTGLLSLRKNKLLPSLLSVLTSFILLLSWYTDRKTMTAHWGFWVILALFLFGGLFQLLLLAYQHMVDLPYLFRTLLAVTIVCLLVNGLLGTYWCTILYGKHFMVYFTPRFIKNLIQIPINTALIYYLLRAMAEIPEFRRLGKN